MTAKRTPKIEALVVNAIRRLQDAQGSTPREITNYIMQEYDASGPQIKRQIQLALRRGVSYGILQCTKGGYYTCNRDFLGKQAIEGDEVTECRSRRRRRSRSRRRSSRRRGCARRRRSSRSRRRRRGCRSRRRSAKRRRRSCGKRRRRRSGSRRRRSRRGRRCRGGMEMDALSTQPKREASVSRNDSQSDGSTVSASSDERQMDEASQDQQPAIPPNARLD